MPDTERGVGLLHQKLALKAVLLYRDSLSMLFKSRMEFMLPLSAPWN